MIQQPGMAMPGAPPRGFTVSIWCLPFGMVPSAVDMAARATPDMSMARHRNEGRRQTSKR
ncbi:hypothetical protein CG716_01800 [Mycolicibacterium sphagni]|uniref:Uncharacterized protein n=1 Tax=Mycolicibacterium sphagni TaxID=1786 RepID=A0A255E091_9MYCO|nr:hypothetical protein CG716_01800 [Mycolicibacterium sphagni]